MKGLLGPERIGRERSTPKADRVQRQPTARTENATAAQSEQHRDVVHGTWDTSQVTAGIIAEMQLRTRRGSRLHVSSGNALTPEIDVRSLERNFFSVVKFCVAPSQGDSASAPSLSR